MRLSTFASDKIFLAALLFSAATLAASFHYLTESVAETMLMEKENLRIESLSIEASQSEFALIGTSHAESHLMPEGVRYIRLTGGHNLPPAMYYEAKALLKYATSIKAVYLEADDHIFMNGASYSVKKYPENDSDISNMYKTWHYYFDSAGKEIFDNYQGASKLTSSVSLQPDVKPILLKRISKRIMEKFYHNEKDVITVEKSAACEKKLDIPEPDLTKETYWSRAQGEKRQTALAMRIRGFSLDKPSPIDPLMAEYYEKTIRLFLDKGIQVIFIRFPISPDFQRMVHPDNTTTIQKYIENLRHKNNIPILDISYLSKYGDRFFENEDHVNNDFFPLIGSLIVDDFCKKRRGGIGPP